MEPRYLGIAVLRQDKPGNQELDSMSIIISISKSTWLHRLDLFVLLFCPGIHRVQREGREEDNKIL